MDLGRRRIRRGAPGPRRRDGVCADEARPDRRLRSGLGSHQVGGGCRDAVGPCRRRRPRLPGDVRWRECIRRGDGRARVAALAAGNRRGTALLGHGLAHRVARGRRPGRLSRHRRRVGVADAARQRRAECPGPGPRRALPRPGRWPRGRARAGHRASAVGAAARGHGDRHPGTRRSDRRRHDRTGGAQSESAYRAIAVAMARRRRGGRSGRGRRSPHLPGGVRPPAARRRPAQRQPAVAAGAAPPPGRVAAARRHHGARAVALHRNRRL